MIPIVSKDKAIIKIIKPISFFLILIKNNIRNKLKI